MSVSLLRVWVVRLVLGFALGLSLPAEARAPDDPLFLQVPVALSPQCGFLAPCGRFDALGLHAANSTVLRGSSSIRPYGY